MRKYSSIASEKVLADDLPVSGLLANTLVLQDVEGLPTIAVGSGDTFTLVLDPDTTDEEIVTVTAMDGTQLTVVRAEEGTSPVPHPAGRKARHMITGRDLQDAQNHIANTTDPHGITISTLATKTYADNAVSTHEADTTAVHGIADTSKLAKVGSTAAGRTIFVQSATPTANAVGDIWFQVTGL